MVRGHPARVEPGALQAGRPAGLDEPGQPSRIELGVEDQAEVDPAGDQGAPGGLDGGLPLVRRDLAQLTPPQLGQAVAGAGHRPPQLLLGHLTAGPRPVALLELRQHVGGDPLEYVADDAQQGEEEGIGHQYPRVLDPRR